MGIKENIETRKAANEFVDLGIDFAKEAGCGLDEQRFFWRCVIDLSAKLIGEPINCAKCRGRINDELGIVYAKPKDPLARAMDQNRLNDNCLMEFGKHKGKKLAEIPDHYFKWFLKQDWCDQWPELVEYANVVIDG
jgi:hypothetical protein